MKANESTSKIAEIRMQTQSIREVIQGHTARLREQNKVSAQLVTELRSLKKDARELGDRYVDQAECLQDERLKVLGLLNSLSSSCEKVLEKASVSQLKE